MGNVDGLEEIIIEVESKCNFKCEFCFNKISFAKKGRIEQNINKDEIFKVIKKASLLGIKNVRFTGGEPLLRSDIFEIFRYAKKNGFYVKLNTNGFLINENNVARFKGVVDNILISLETGNIKEEEKITKIKSTLEHKIEAIKLLQKNNPGIVRIGTVISKKGIAGFDDIAEIVKKYKIRSWEWYRPIGISKKISKSMLERLCGKIFLFNKKELNTETYFANPLPFCFINKPEIINSLSLGASIIEGRGRIVLDPRGFWKPEYYIEKKLGKSSQIEKSWNNIFIKKIRNDIFLPKECNDCIFVEKCKGGSRTEAFFSSGHWNKPDPLSNFKNKFKKK